VSTVGTIVLYGLALVGALCILGSVGWFLTVWRTVARGAHDPAEPTPASEVVAAHTGNVRVIDRADFTRGTVGTGGYQLEDFDGTPVWVLRNRLGIIGHLCVDDPCPACKFAASAS
jgi:hypothetical protein